MNVQFGENLKRLRKQKGVTQGEVAKVLAVSGQSVSRWELGICYPDLEWLPKIANYFGVTVDSLLSNDQAAKNEDIRQFYSRYESFEYASAPHIRFIKGYCKRYPDNDQYACLLIKAICAAILNKREDVESNYYALLYEYGERLLETQFRNEVIEAMICVCSESELEKWLGMCPVNATFHRRTCLAKRYAANGQYDQLNTQQGLAMFENFAQELDHRYPDTNGAENKEAFLRAIMRVICSFGESNEPPAMPGNSFMPTSSWCYHRACSHKERPSRDGRCLIRRCIRIGLFTKASRRFCAQVVSCFPICVSTVIGRMPVTMRACGTSYPDCGNALTLRRA